MKVRAALHRFQYALADRRIREQVHRIEAWLDDVSPSNPSDSPVFFYNPSTRIHHLSLNGAFALLASWIIRRHGVPVQYLVCQRGLEQCILGTDWANPAEPPPCGPCMRYSEDLFPERLVIGVRQDPVVSARIASNLESKSLVGLESWSYDGLPLGQLCLPGLRWALRRHHLRDESATVALFTQYLRSAAMLASQLSRVFERTRPRSLVVFNGLMYPEAVAKAIAQREGIPTVTHEVGLKPYSAFFSHGQATFREVQPPSGIELVEEQNRELETYLLQRREGRFSMAGVKFWPEIRPLPERIRSGLDRFPQLVSIFTNVVFDTSQVHANTLYPDMFAWLDDVAAAIRRHPETLFVIRAHPDEDRPGKASQESVAEWVWAQGLEGLENLVFLSPGAYVSSYELIERSKAVLVYNSSVGLEAAIMGVPVLCAGRARYAQIAPSLLPESDKEYRQRLESLLNADEIELVAETARKARAFLYTELNQASLDFSEFLAPYPVLPGMVTFQGFDPARLERSNALETVAKGILEGRPFLLADGPIPSW